MEEWIEEFLYRGRPPSGPGSELPSVFQVTIGQQVASPFGDDQPPIRRTIGPLTPEQAAAAGWSLTKIVKGLNTAALAEVDAARAALIAAQQETSALRMELAQKSVELSQKPRAAEAE